MVNENNRQKTEMLRRFKILTLYLIILCSPPSIQAKNLVTNESGQESADGELTITISSSKDFSDFYGMLCDGYTFANQTIVLSKDISFDSGGKVGTKTFEGTFDGQQHKLKDVTSSLFTYNYGEIRNLHIESGSLNGSGIFCTDNYGIIINCKNSANIHYSSSSSEGIKAAAFCSSNYGNITNCINEGNVELELVAIYGQWSKATSSCGGICAYSGKSSSIINCTNSGSIKNSGIYFSVTGGIVATSEYARIVGCKNQGLVYSYVLNSSPTKGCVTVESYQHQHVGGIAGHVLYSTINRCKNYGTVKSNFQYLGGIAGYVGNSDVYNLENFGDLDGYEGYGFHSVSGIIPYFHNPYKRQYFLNCINHGKISAFAKYGIATSAGISADIENAYIANCYSAGSVSSTNTGNMSESFQIPQYEYENSEELNAGINNITDANSFISTYDSPETLLKWSEDTGTVTLCDTYFSLPIAQHGSSSIFVYPEDLEKRYTLKIWENDNSSQEAISLISDSPLEARGLTPETDYYYEILSEDGAQFLDNGRFHTLSPDIRFYTSSIGYDSLEFKHFCDAKGVDELETYLIFGKSELDPKKFEATDSTINVAGLDEETSYTAKLLYYLNGKEYLSDKINVSTKAIVPQFSLISASPYSISLKCDNFEELEKYHPVLYIENPKYYDFGGFKVGESQTFELDSDGKTTIDSLLYGYTPKLFGKYTINGEERLRTADNFSTSDWGGESIIQLSPNAAMIHGLFGGMGKGVDGNSSRYPYNRARFYYRDATASDGISNNYADGGCIDGSVDYATTIPFEKNSFLYQYYISLQDSYGHTNSKNGEWQIIDSRNSTVDIVEPRFFNVRFENNTFKWSCIRGEEKIICRFLEYKVEGISNYNNITLSQNAETEALSKTLTSIVPQLSYIVRLGCDTDNGKTYYSNYYRLHDNTLEVLEEYEDLILISSITMDKAELTIPLDKTDTLSCEVLPKNASNNVLSWSSSDEGIASVNNGVITPHKIGETVVVASSTDGSNKSASCNIEITEPTGVCALHTDTPIFIRTIGNVVQIFGARDTSIVRIYNESGTLVFKSYERTIKNLNPGIYFIRIEGKIFKVCV